MSHKNYRIAIIGLGYVGLPLALRFAGSGHYVVGVDSDPTKVRVLNKGESYIRHILSKDIAFFIENKKFIATCNFSEVSKVDAILICVPTPLNNFREPDLSFVLNTAKSIAPYLSQNVVVVLESTTYPGTTEGELKKVLEAGSGKKAGKDFHLAFSPEREDPGNPQSDVRSMPKLVGGLTPNCLKAALKVYSSAVENLVPVSSCRVAEATKLTENIFRSVNIALVNELKMIYERMGIDIWEVIEAAKTKPFGFMPFYPGPGLGGHCIPIDPFYLTWKAREFEMHTKFIELAGQINTAMPEYVVGKTAEALNNEGKAVKGSRILILGLAYKPNVDDDRESPSYVIMDLLERMGAKIFYSDPYVPHIKLTRKHPRLAGRKSLPISPDFDAVVICTAHEEFKKIDFSNFDIPVVDTRNCVSKKNNKYYRA